jgi:hypothetical protein
MGRMKGLAARAIAAVQRATRDARNRSDAVDLEIEFNSDPAAFVDKYTHHLKGFTQEELRLLKVG